MKTYKVEDADYWAFIVANNTHEAQKLYLKEVAEPEDLRELSVSELTEKVLTTYMVSKYSDTDSGFVLDIMTLQDFVKTGPQNKPWTAIVCADLL